MQHVSAFVDTHSLNMADMIAVEILDNNEQQKVSEDLDFIDLYGNEPSLWDVTSQVYHDKIERKRALQRIDGKINIGVDKINKRINNLRTYYKREMNKVEDSKRSGAGTCEIYESKWPMYQSMDKFLRTQVRKRVSKSNINSSTTEGDDNADDSGSDSVTANSSTSSTTAKKRKQMSKDNKSDLLLQKAIDTLNIPEEEDSNDAIFGKYVGTSLSAMPENVNKFILKNKIQNLVCETQILNLNQQYQSSNQQQVPRSQPQQVPSQPQQVPRQPQQVPRDMQLYPMNGSQSQNQGYTQYIDGNQYLNL
ncbi:unnamed protein product [Mytilus edulis]|uniref:MADF domain-containing protein n=1 Tax=Mytilus edulis TaxID=6550 RepID=A0A8S3U7V7_MYTED|nr:unnamed protein product [Mytilus edulis]